MTTIQAKKIAGAGIAIARADSALSTDDHYSQCECYAGDGGPAVRKVVAGVSTALTAVSGAVTEGDVIKLPIVESRRGTGSKTTRRPPGKPWVEYEGVVHPIYLRYCHGPNCAPNCRCRYTPAMAGKFRSSKYEEFLREIQPYLDKLLQKLSRRGRREGKSG